MLDELFEVGVQLVDVLVFVYIDLLPLEGLDEAFAEGIVVRIPGAAQTSHQGHQELFDRIVELSTAMREARLAVYSISLGQANMDTFLYQGFLKGVKTPDKANPQALGLKVLAVQSGGRVLGPDNNIAAQIVNCIRDSTAFYTLSFDPPRADRANEYHDLKVQVEKPGLTARTNTGYYNQP